MSNWSGDGHLHASQELITVKDQTGAEPERQYRTIEEKRRIVEETLVEVCTQGAQSSH